MSEKTFKPGDVVELKSEGPRMTVDSVTENRCQCIWFLNGIRHEASFSHVALKTYEK